MKEKWKSYLVFAPRLYRTVMYLFVPVFLAALAVWLSSAGEVALIPVMALLVMIEIVSDAWMFGGIQTNERVQLDYLKTSARGRKVMKNALTMDMVRRLLYAAGIMGICKLAIWLASGMAWQSAAREAGFWKAVFFGGGAAGGSGGLGIWLFLTFVSYFLSVLGTFLSRFGSMMWINMMVGYIFGTLAVLLLRLPGLSQYVFGYALLFGALGAAAGILAVRTAMKKMEEGYYDK